MTEQQNIHNQKSNEFYVEIFNCTILEFQTSTKY